MPIQQKLTPLVLLFINFAGWISFMWSLTLHFYLGEMSVGRQEAFELFKRDYADHELIEENKKGLKSRYVSYYVDINLVLLY